MDFDYIAFWIVKEDLMPFFGESCAIIGVMDTLAIQKGHKCSNIVSTESDMTPFNGIDDLTVLEGNSQVLGRQVHLHFAICGKSNLSVIAA